MTCFLFVHVFQKFPFIRLINVFISARYEFIRVSYILIRGKNLRLCAKITEWLPKHILLLLNLIFFNSCKILFISVQYLILLWQSKNTILLEKSSYHANGNAPISLVTIVDIFMTCHQQHNAVLYKNENISKEFFRWHYLNVLSY